MKTGLGSCTESSRPGRQRVGERRLLLEAPVHDEAASTNQSIGANKVFLQNRM